MSNTTKTGREWLNLMPEPYQTQARTAIKEQSILHSHPNDLHLNSEFSNFKTFLRFAFSWSSSGIKETKMLSFKYWQDFANNLPEHLRD